MWAILFSFYQRDAFPLPESAFISGLLLLYMQVGQFDIDTLRFKGSGSVVHLPRDNHCEVSRGIFRTCYRESCGKQRVHRLMSSNLNHLQMTYCNAEGIQWIDADRVIVVSDKAKTKQPFWCDAKDQSVHIFAIPPSVKAAIPNTEATDY